MLSFTEGVCPSSNAAMFNVAPHYADAYRKGYLAGRRGRTGADNPYEKGSREAWAWAFGLFDGLTRQLTVVRSE
jgi:hypothetical protein